MTPSPILAADQLVSQPDNQLKQVGLDDMDIPIDAEVRCTDSVCGRSSSVVINPINKEVTHLVVKLRSFPHTERLVSIDKVLETSPRLIRLRCSQHELAEMEAFVETEYIPTQRTEMGFQETGYDYPGGAYFMWPYAIPQESQYIPVENQLIPPHELVIRRGARVEAVDGHAGKVDEFLVNPVNCHISHLVLREGHLWGQKDVTIPVSEIDRFAADAIYLKLNKASIEALPTIPVRRVYK